MFKWCWFPYCFFFGQMQYVSGELIVYIFDCLFNFPFDNLGRILWGKAYLMIDHFAA